MSNVIDKHLKKCWKKSISQSDFAHLCSVQHSIIGKYERDEVKPSMDVIKNIAADLGTKVSELSV